MSIPVQRFADFDPSTISEGSVRSLDNGAKIVFLNHCPGNDAGLTPIVLQTNERRTIKGIEQNDFGDGPSKYTLELALDQSDDEYKKLDDMDNAIVDLAFNSGSKWLRSKSGSTYSKDMIREKYTPSLRIPRDKEGNVTDRWPPTFRMSIPQDKTTGDFLIEVWDETSGETIKVPPKDFAASSRNSRLTVIARCTGIWVAGNSFGVSWKAQQILVHSSGRSSLGSFAFIKTNSKPPRPAPLPETEDSPEDEFLEDSQ